MNSYEKAQQILGLIVSEALPLEPDFTLPELQYARVGTPVVACASLQVSALDMNTDGANVGLLNVLCDDAIQMTNFACILSRECAWTANEDGSDDPAQVAAMSVVGAADAAFLWDFAQHYDEYLSKSFSVGWSTNGGLVITTLNMLTGVD